MSTMKRIVGRMTGSAKTPNENPHLVVAADVLASGAPVPEPRFKMGEIAKKTVVDSYAKADVILEYGSGGSTAMAAKLPNKTIFSVESDQSWAAMMQKFFEQTPPAEGTTVKVVHADIGPTRDWGKPVNHDAYLKYAGYPYAIWQDPDFVQPDVVLVDGRFRRGCILATALMTKKPVDVLVDDYRKREVYHDIEEWVGAPELKGRLAHFKIEPLKLDQSKLLDVIQVSLDIQ